MAKCRPSGRRLDRRLISSIKEEIRLDLLRILNERSATPRELAEALQDDPDVVADHVVKLWGDGCIEAVTEAEPRRALVDRRYRVSQFFFVGDREASDLSTADREEMSAVTLQAILSEAVEAVRAGSLDSRTDRHLSWMPMRLDEEGWREVMAMLTRTLNEAEAIREACAVRLACSGQAGTEAIVSMLGFERSRSPAA